MNWEAITSIAEMIGATGVILSLLYVGRELKQSNMMARSATRQEVNSALNSWCMSVATSTVLSDDIAQAQLNDLIRDEAPDAQKMRIGYALFSVINQHRYVYEQWKEGVINENELNEIFGAGSSGLFSTPYLRSVWPVLKHSFPGEFSEWFSARYQLDKEVQINQADPA